MFYQKSVEQVEKELATDLNRGLTKKEVGIRLIKFGHNILPTKPKPPIILHFIEQFKNILVVILLLASVISLFLGDLIDALAIFAIVILNASIGFIQEVKAEKTLESLKQQEILYAFVIRNGVKQQVPSTEIVAGDLLVLAEGEKVPADARIIEEFSLTVDESVLTGESLPVSKSVAAISQKEVPLADQVNMIYKDSKIVSGRGKAIVFATGENTEIGKIAQSLAETKAEKTPLTRELEKVAHTLTLVIVIIAALIFALNLASEIPFVESLLVSISLSVAAIPEGLPAIVTIVLSFGVKRLAEKKSIIKKLPAVETLGAVRIIATDKTGTLTQNKINVVKIILPDGQNIALKGKGYQLKGFFFDLNNKRIKPEANAKLIDLLKAGVLANDASIEERHKKEPKVLGDTTEAALLVAAYRAGLKVSHLVKKLGRIFEKPFTSDRKMMSVIIQENKKYYLYVKGAPEIMINKCTLTDEQRKTISQINDQLAKQGLRSLILAKREVSFPEVQEAYKIDSISEGNLTYLGIVAMQDPLRIEVKYAIQSAKEAGIRTIMITGDHKETATTIALEAGIIEKQGKVLTEKDVQKMSITALSHEIQKGISVFARISPLGKLKIIQAIKKLPHTQVAVTGDGVNDAPALKAAHIGVAMGKTGTDLTREVADMVITDDNYATIIDAIREGRIIYANLVKFIRYLISCNLSEVLVVTAGVLFATPLPLLPIQILWINLVTDGFPALALGMDPAEHDVMKAPPRNLAEGILHKKRWAYMIIEGSIIGIATFLLFVFAISKFNYRQAQTMAFTTLAFAQLVHAFNNRSTRKSILEIGPFTNIYLVCGVTISIVLQYLVVQTNLGNAFFKTEPLNFPGWLYIILFSLVPLIVVELKKQLRFKILP